MSGDQTESFQPKVGATVPKRYSTGLIIFHWISALIVLVMIGTGWWMLELIHDPVRMKSAFPIFQFHKSLGVLVFVITVGRITLRLRRQTPRLPASMPRWERLTALVAQATFYLLLIAIPVTGWLYISTEWAESLDKEFRAPSLFFGQVAVPYASAIAEADAGFRRYLSFHLSGVHAWLAFGLLALIALHAAAAFKHHLVDRDEVLSHMVPNVRHQSGREMGGAAPSPGLASLRIWLIASVVVAVVAVLGWMNNPAPPPVATVEATQAAAQQPASQLANEK